MTSAVEPTLDKINPSIEGFFWALPNIAIALVTFLLFIIGAWVAKRAIIGVFSRRHRADLGGLWAALAGTGRVRFHDSTLQPAVDLDIEIGSLEMRNIDTGATTQPTTFDVAGRLGELSQFSLSGSARPFAQQRNFDVSAHAEGVQLHKFSSYARPGDRDVYRPRDAASRGRCEGDGRSVECRSERGHSQSGFRRSGSSAFPKIRRDESSRRTRVCAVGKWPWRSRTCDRAGPERLPDQGAE